MSLMGKVMDEIHHKCWDLVGYKLGSIAFAPLEWYVYTGRIPTPQYWQLCYCTDKQKAAIAKHLVACHTHDEAVTAITKYLKRAKNHYPRISH